MERLYLDLCRKHSCDAKVFTKMKGALKRKFGTPNLFILFTNTVSHNMVNYAICEAKRCKACVERCHSSSLAALDSILSSYCID